MKKVIWKIIKTLIILAILGGLGYGGYYLYQKNNTSAQETTTSYTQVQVTTGSLEKTVSGTGSLSISDTESVMLNFPVTISSTKVRAGQEVKVGDVLFEVDQDALKSTITTLNTELADIDTSLATLASQYSDDTYITNAIAGVVKAIYASAGDMTQTVVSQYDGILLLSIDGKMKVTIASDTLTVGATATVVDGSYSYTGTVAAVGNGMATITFSDKRTLPGALVSVAVSGVQVGNGTAEINMPFTMTTSVDGYISKAYVAVNDSLSRNTRCFYVTQIPADTEYDTYTKQRETKAQALKAAKEALKSGVICATVDGIVNTISSPSLDEITSNTELASIYVGDAKQMVISVDELDIIDVAVGQSVTIAMDAVTSKEYTATVSYISQIGTASSGVTTYSVTLDVDGDDQLKMGMNGTATIKIEDVENVLLVPITALNTSTNGEYVWLYSTDAAAVGDNPGIQTFITTGLSNDSYAQVLSGLSLGDYVMVTRSASSSSTSTTPMGGMDMGGMDMGSMTAPSGSFTPPSGSGSMPSGGGAGGGSGYPSRGN